MSSTPTPDYHQPVMLQECLEGLNIRPNGIYVDVTFGGGGHSRAILKQLGPEGRLLSFDQDPDAKAESKFIEDKQFTFIEANFRYLKKFLRLNGVRKVDGILADLGISSHQIDVPERGFSTRFDGPLDMRMNPEAEFSAKDVINTYDEAQLHKIFGLYGEVKNARTLANAVYAARQNGAIETVQELKAVLQKFAPRGKEFKYFAQVFQAIRIEVNEEMKVLEEFLEQVPEVLAPEGRLVVMSYHSLEDRLVKNFIRSGKFQGEAEKDLYGNELKPLKSVIRKPIEATADEIALNSRARSARLRIAEPN
ncbi:MULTISPECIES: 16S rRNA (cytosine(1402)-N(4))-methyltransferase RsmH [unclassified Siphonobacter]|uniref:16S rRNA (cytosine(1402)-N(4))-methyltransferase RsmH n=1 Tax=unclassified Siphonobacter TaxID=2635712 RepID=UPI002784A351|nr:MULTISPECIES: 16S rRNA (cytosine(1402)-N(4))-methyltransferase RsmH [unclassified Siphonobacter]MDQ1087977.1 16S rRNA (cytosine1402-N4)-methyltransferase [Siphonobacter sp. SORGH_AS_1065]MDR6194126.1 16S rRNA (cytosine1402-N4)-methyltransferase [Siphonobacter sp. SORGH_AS_0500]